MEVELYGKPFEFTFNFTANELKAKAKEQGAEISKFYMIGDNPETDIKGAN